MIRSNTTLLSVPIRITDFFAFASSAQASVEVSGKFRSNILGKKIVSYVLFFLIGAGISLSVSNKALAAVEQRCNELGANCVCSEPLQTTVFNQVNTYFWDAADTTKTDKQCHTIVSSPGYEGTLISHGSRIWNSLNSGTAWNALPSGHSLKYIQLNDEGPTGSFSLQHVWANDPIPTARRAQRLYLYYTPNFVFSEDYNNNVQPGVDCQNSGKTIQLSEQGGGILTFNANRWLVHAWAYKYDGVNSYWGANPTDQVQLGATGQGLSMTYGDFKGKWWRYEIVYRNLPGPKTIVEVYLKNVTDNTPEFKILDTSQPSVYTDRFGNQTPWTASQANNLSLAQGGWNMYWDLFRNPAAGRNNCAGAYGFTEFAAAAWDTDAGQRIGAACEVEGGCGGTAPTPDTSAPSVPTNLTASTVSSTQINLSWTASLDNVGVSGYRIYRSGVQIATVAGTTYSDTNLTPSTAYVYTVSAYDTSNNSSTQSSSTSATTSAAPLDTMVPAVSLSAPTGGSTVSSSITVSASASDNVGVAGVQFKLDGTNLGAEDTTAPYSITWDTTSATNVSHTLTASARDAAGNQTTSAGVTITVSNSVSSAICEAATGSKCYYVSNKAGSGTGTFADPYGMADLPRSDTVSCSLSSPAIGPLMPGDVLYFRGGNYSFTTCGAANYWAMGYIRPARSGLAGKPITFKAYPSETVQVQVGSGTQPTFGTVGLNYIRFQGFTVLGGFGMITGRNNEISYNEIIGSFVNNVFQHDGISVGILGDVTDAPWIHHNIIRGVTGLSENSAGLKFYGTSNSLVEDNYIHDNTAGIHNKIDNKDNTFRRNWISNNEKAQLMGGAAANYYWRAFIYDNVIDGNGVNSIYVSSNTEIHDNLIRGDTLAGTWLGDSATSNIWNNIVLSTTGSVRGYYDSAANFVSSGVTAQLNYMNYNLYNVSPSYPFGKYTTTPQNFTLLDMKNRGFEQNSSAASNSQIFVDEISYNLQNVWKTSGRYGDAYGPDNIAQIINPMRYGPGALSLGSAPALAPTPPSSDTTSPTTPTSLTASIISSSQINLSWTASTDNIGVTGYKIYRNGTQIATTATNSYANTSLTPSTTYSYTVSAYDLAGNTSVQSASVSATTPSAPLPSATYLIAYAMNEGSGTTLTDTSGTGHTGTLTTGPTRVASQTGYDQALSFDGVSGSVSVANPATLNVGTADFTIEAWVKRTALGTNQRHIFSKCGTTWSIGCKEFYFNRNNQLTFGSYATGDTFSSTITDTNWHHVAATFTSSSKTLSIYVDGALTTTTTKNLEADNAAHVVTIGNQQNNNTFSGLIDDFRMYSRALTLAEIQSDKATPIAAASIPPSSDTTAPTTPTNLSATAISSSQINLSWTASTDNTSVTGYRIYRNGTQIATTATNSYSNTALTQATAYTYTVSAYDLASNVSAQSVAATATTQSVISPSISSSPIPGLNDTIIFQDDFEGGNLSRWDEVSPARYSITSVPANVKSGTGALEALIDSVSSGNLGKWYMPGYDEVYVAFDMKFETGFQNLRSDGSGMHFFEQLGNRVDNQWSASGKAGIRPSGTDFFESVLDPNHIFNDPTLRPLNFYTYYPDMSCSAAPALCYGNIISQTPPAAPLTTGVWHKVVFRIKTNTVGQKDGAQSLWFNGVQKIDMQNIRWRDTTNLKLNQLRFDFYMPGAVTTEHVWIDNLVAWTPSATSIPASVPVSSKFIINNRVQSTATLNVRSSASLLGTALDSQPAGVLGTVTSGPIYADGFFWWQVNYDTGVDGWSVEDYLITYTAPIIDTTAPTISLTTPTSGTTVSSSVTLSATASDNATVTGVQFKLDGSNLGTEDTTSPYSITWNTTSATNGIHTLTASARDAAGNQTTSTSVTVTTSNITVTPDTIAPSAPTNLTTTPNSSQINLAWTASTDNVGVAGYRIYRNGTQITTVTTNSYANTGLSPSTSYTYTVAAYDAAGNASAQSTNASGSTQSAPVTTTTTTNTTNTNTNTNTATTNTTNTSTGAISSVPSTPATNSTGASATAPTPPPSTTPTTSSLTLTRSLYQGLKGTDVKNLQTFLIQHNYLAPTNSTGFYGALTKQAVQKYQCAQNIVCSGTETSTGYGVVGLKTRAKLNGTSTSTPYVSTSNLTPAQADAIIALIQSFGADAAVIARVRVVLGR